MFSLLDWNEHAMEVICTRKSLHWALVPFQSIYRISFLSIFERLSSLHNSSVHASNLVPLIKGADEMQINKQITMLG